MLRGPALLSNMIIATTPEAGGLVATIIFGLRNGFPLLDVPMWLFGSLMLALALGISSLCIPIGTIFLRINMYFR
jgi:hypothetical protein